MESEWIWQIIAESTIYDVNLATKAIQAFEQRPCSLEVGQGYDVEIIFDKNVYEREEFYSFPLSREEPDGTREGNLSRSEKRKKIISAILREQLDKVIEAIETLGIVVVNSTIVGDFFTPNFVRIKIYKCKNDEGSGKKEAPRRGVKFIMPTRITATDLDNKVMELLARQERQERKEQEQREQHSPNWFSAEELFSEIVRAMYPVDEEKAILHKEMLYDTAIQIADFPLYLKSGRNKKEGRPIDRDARLDCPEYVVYMQHTTGEWSIEKTENLKTAQEIIVKRGYNQKRTERIIVLHNLKSVPYILFKQTDEGLVMVAPEEARGEKKLFLSWNK